VVTCAKNGRTERDAVWVVASYESKESCVRWVQIPNEKGQFCWSELPTVKCRDFFRELCRNDWTDPLSCRLGWAEGSTSSIVFARWRQCTRRYSAESCAKTAEPIVLPFGLLTRVGWRKHKFNHIRQVAPYGRGHCRHLANMIEPSVCGGDAVLRQITLTTCFNY